MIDHELSVAMQQERERAIREARLHHRGDLPMKPSRRSRLMAMAHAWTRGPATVRPGAPASATAEPTPPTASVAAGCVHGPVVGRSGSIPG